ncbi:MAG: NAD-dependent epimerase/dehydratase family protein [Chloroflexi bacterium]|nr:NAD-dependent epimerase/dehydratase family protein [Chloroflexota bacterium]
MTTFLITGGAGFLGINLARYLLARGHTVTTLDITDFTYNDVKDQIRHLKGDVRDRNTVEEAMRGVDIVVHTAAALPLYPPEEIYSTDVRGTETILAAAAAHGVDRFIHISSTAVYGIPNHHPLVETDRLEGVGPYGQAKILAEELCETYRAKDLCVTIIRPKSFIGPERLGVFALLYDWAYSGKNFPVLGNGKNRYQLLDVEDLCQAIYLAATVDRALANDTFNIGAAEFTTFAEDYQAVLDRAGYGKKIIPLRLTPLFITILRALELFHLSPLYKWVYETAAKDSFVSIEKAQKQLGFHPQYSNKQALIRNYEWHVAHHDQFAHTSGVSHRVPWKQGALSLAKIFF